MFVSGTPFKINFLHIYGLFPLYSWRSGEGLNETPLPTTIVSNDKRNGPLPSR